MKKLLYSIFNILVLLFYATPAFAVTIPTFPSCANPQGDLKVSYSQGTHGIVGSSSNYTGSDAVYQLTADSVTQCFCSEDGVGIQTNWWKATALSEQEIDVLKSDGWVYIPTGSVWGLDQDPYVAKNISYSCLPGSTSGGSNGSTSSEEHNGTGGGDILGDSTGKVLGLAATGDSIFIYASFALGFILLLLGLRRLRHRE